MISELQLKRSIACELVFTHRHWQGWIAAASAILTFIWVHSLDPEPAWTRVVELLDAALLLGSGVVCALLRDRLVLDLWGRTFRRRQGLLWASRMTTGTFDEIDGLVLAHDVGDDKPWRIELAFKARAERVLIDKTKDESAAYASLRRYARRLQLPACDSTAEGTPRWVQVERPRRGDGRRSRHQGPLQARQFA